MKQKIVIQVPMRCESCRSKALKIGSVSKGRVDSVAVEGGDRDRVVVIGEDIDSVCLAKALRKKFGHANIVSVGEVKEKKKEENNTSIVGWPLGYYSPPPPPPPSRHNLVCEQHHDDGTCTVL